MSPPYKSRPWPGTQVRRARNKPRRTWIERREALAVHDRIQRISDEIRERHGLPPVPENSVVLGWRRGV